MIHRASCPNVKNAEPFRLIEAQWDSNHAAPFAVSLTIETKDSGGVLARITKALSDMKLSIESLTARVTDKDNKGIISLAVRVGSPEQLEYVINKLKAVRDVTNVYRAMN